MAAVLESRGWHRAWLRYVSGLRGLLLGLAARLDLLAEARIVLDYQLAALLTRLLISGRRITARQTPSILTQRGLFFLASSSPREALPLRSSLGWLFQYSEALRGAPGAHERAGGLLAALRERR